MTEILAAHAPSMVDLGPEVKLAGRNLAQPVLIWQALGTPVAWRTMARHTDPPWETTTFVLDPIRHDLADAFIRVFEEQAYQQRDFLFVLQAEVDLTEVLHGLGRLHSLGYLARHALLPNGFELFFPIESIRDDLYQITIRWSFYFNRRPPPKRLSHYTLTATPFWQCRGMVPQHWCATCGQQACDTVGGACMACGAPSFLGMAEVIRD